MNIAPPRNPNYCATVTEITSLSPAPGLDNLKYATFHGFRVLVGADTAIGTRGLFFPVGTQISSWILALLNLYRHSELNDDKIKTGFFEEHGRVKPIKLRGNVSDGFWMPISDLASVSNSVLGIPVGTDFDEIDGIVFCKKYEVPSKAPGAPGSRAKASTDKSDLIVKGQFRFHSDTKNIRRFIDNIPNDSVLSITEKYHGTSAVFSKVLIHRKLSFVERFFNKFFPSLFKIQTQEYGPVVSSRNVIKSVGAYVNPDKGFYNESLWEKVAYGVLNLIPDGYTLYGEIVGHLDGGKPVQKGYSYGCRVGRNKFLVYRITYTPQHGDPIELGLHQRLHFCSKYGLEHVRVLEASYKFFSTNQWSNIAMASFEYLANNLTPLVGDGPPEGIVIRVESNPIFEAYKLKTQEFLDHESKQLDAGTVDIETEETA